MIFYRGNVCKVLDNAKRSDTTAENVLEKKKWATMSSRILEWRITGGYEFTDSHFSNFCRKTCTANSAFCNISKSIFIKQTILPQWGGSVILIIIYRLNFLNFKIICNFFNEEKPVATKKNRIKTKSRMAFEN